MGRRGRHELFSLVDKALSGRLVELLKERREAGDSYDAIAKMLYEQGIEVSGETVRRWCNDIFGETTRGSAPRKRSKVA